MPRKPNTRSTKPHQPRRKILDEVCSCGHVRSRHDRRGYGPCSVALCSCKRYTWDHFIYDR